MKIIDADAKCNLISSILAHIKTKAQNYFGISAPNRSLRKPQRLVLIAILSVQLKTYKGLVLTAIWISASNPVVWVRIIQDSASIVICAYKPGLGKMPVISAVHLILLQFVYPIQVRSD